MSLGSMELCEGVHTAQRQTTTQIPIEFCILVIGLSLGLSLSHCQSDYTIMQQYTVPVDSLIASLKSVTGTLFVVILSATSSWPCFKIQ